jgi:hypothetical protein
MAKVAKSHRHTIPRATRIPRSPLTRVDVTRGEFNRIIDILNDRNAMLNALRDAITHIEQASDVQFKRIAQMQAELDAIRKSQPK